MINFVPFRHTLCLIACLAAINTTHSVATEYQPPEDISFTSNLDGSTQRYIRLLPVGFSKKGPHDILIALHGHGSDRMQMATSPRDECKGLRDGGAARDMIFISPDYRAKTSWMGPSAEADIVQLISELKNQFNVDKLIISGGSMGASSSLSFAAIHPELVDGVVALNPLANHFEYENFQEAIAESFGGTKQEVPKEYKKRSAEYWPLRFTMPLAICTGGKDTSVPPDSAIRLAMIVKRLNEDVLLLHRPETGHTTNYDDTREALLFVLERLRR